LGPNGAGKTSFIRILNQITAPDNGEVWINGEKLKAEHIGIIGYLPEERGLYKKMKVGEQALYLAQLKGMPKAEALKKLKYWFEKFQIQSWWNKRIEELSKGMQQKVQFIVTILHEPKLLIFDEPFSGFDPINTNLIKNEMLHLKEKGATIILSTHNMNSVEELCDNIALINQSKVILSGSVHEIKQQFKSHIFQIEYTSNNKSRIEKSESYHIIEELEKPHSFLAKIKILPEFSHNDVLSQLMKQVNITAFHEILPSMNEIFIECIQNQQTAQ